MGNRCSAFIYPQHIAEYQELHKAICLNLNRMIWNIAFLKKAKEAQENGVRCRNDFVISHLYKNEFELLILRLNRTFFDKGQDVITLSRLKDNLFSKYLFSEYKEKLSISLKNITWDTAEVVSARRRLEDTVPTFRNQYIAHSLIGEIDEVSVSFIDSEKVVMAACDLFSRLGFGLDSFYLGEEKFYLNFIEEKSSSEHFLEDFFLFQQTSAWCIKKLDCEYSSDDQKATAKEKIDKINLIFSDFVDE